jgi:hypothetical protein
MDVQQWGCAHCKKYPPCFLVTRGFFQQFTKFRSRNMSCKFDPQNPLNSYLTQTMWYVNSQRPMLFFLATKIHIPKKKKKKTSVTQMFVENMA